MESNNNYIRLETVNVMQGLETALQGMVEHMKFDPLNSFCLWTDKQVETFDKKAVAEEPFDNWDAIEINDGVYCVNKITNIPHLVIQIQLDSDQEQCFLKLENASLYTKDKVCRGQYMVDCGGDYKMAAYLYSEVARLVFLFEGERNFQQRELYKFQDNPACFHMDFRFSPEKLRDTEYAAELAKEVEAYNKEASKKGAPLLSWDATSGTLTGQSVEGKAKRGLLYNLKRGLYAACGQQLQAEGNALRRHFMYICYMGKTATYLCKEERK